MIISAAKSKVYTATLPGRYRARFSRLSTAPGEAQWNRWSAMVTVTDITSTAEARTRVDVPDEDFVLAADTLRRQELFVVYPNPADYGNLNVQWNGGGDAPLHITLIDGLGREVYGVIFDRAALSMPQPLVLPSTLRAGIYVLVATQGTRQVRKKIVMKG